jgi:hypothetical protein
MPDNKSLVETTAEAFSESGGQELAGHLYRLVAERVRQRALDESEAKVIADWFDRLAKGEDPRKVFQHRRGGRPRKGRNGPDDSDIAWIVHLALARGVKPAAVYLGVAKAHGLKPRTVQNIYGRLKAEVSELHKNWA